MAVMQPNSDDYKGCWNCIFHDDADGFETHCAWSKSNNAIVYLRCPAWVKKDKENTDEYYNYE